VKSCGGWWVVEMFPGLGKFLVRKVKPNAVELFLTITNMNFEF